MVFVEQDWTGQLTLVYFCAEDDAPTKDKTYRKYAAGIDRALTLFETALQEWADYISFLNRLLKVRAPPFPLCASHLRLSLTGGLPRHFKLAPNP